VRGHLRRAEAPHEQRDGAERAELQHVLRADGRAEPQHAHERRGHERVRAPRAQVAAEHRPADRDQARGHQRAARRGRPRRAHAPERRRAERAVDQHPVEHHVGDVGDRDHGDDRRHAADGLHRLPQHDEEQEGQDPRDRRARVRGRLGMSSGGWPSHRAPGSTAGIATPTTTPRPTASARPRCTARAMACSSPAPTACATDRVERHERAHAECHAAEEVDVAERHGGERGGERWPTSWCRRRP
jgi:hypothetical protein